MRSALALTLRGTGLWLAAGFLSCCLATEINQASEAELDSIKGLGPASTARILKAREKGPFKDWTDLMQRVKGIKPAKAEQLSREGLTVAEKPYVGAP
jgi:competence protein ComEA